MATKKSKKKSTKKKAKKTSSLISRNRRKSSSKKAASRLGAKASQVSDPLRLFGHPEVPVTSKAECEKAFQKLQAGRQAMKETTARQRIALLKKLRKALKREHDALCEAVYLDFRKSKTETELTESLVVEAEINDAIRGLSDWMSPKHVETPLTLLGSSSWVAYEPLGTVLILSPWNYPFQLAIAPLVPAIAAGNTVAIKPSEFTPHTSRFLRQLIEDVFEEDQVVVLEGDHRTATALTALPFDHIFFTGSTPVGKLVMKSAAEHLSSVTLELGGKSPAIIDESAELRLSAERILWGKGVNAGQTCVAPDYAFVPKAKLDDFLKYFRLALEKMYGKDVEKSPDFCRIINEKSANRLKALIDDAKRKKAKVVIGGRAKPKERFVEPTVLVNPDPKSKVMQEEIFGPILPLVTYDSLEEVYKIISEKDKPLALYIFAKKARRINEILTRTTAGGTVINDVMVHLANGHLPFGGINQSGLGNYHGEYGFRALSHERALLKQSRWSTLRLFYPPYTARVGRFLKWTRNFLV